MDNIQETISMVVEGKEYQVYAKEMVPWEPDVDDCNTYFR